ncbi:MAG: hypothetical protein HY902_05240, partial [Deltaproteobacteria bacterium]|nr:hypothetical protein [Deltaproteobacteria bacterium]
AISDIRGGVFTYDEHLRPWHVLPVSRGRFDLRLDKTGALVRGVEVVSRTWQRTDLPSLSRPLQKLLHLNKRMRWQQPGLTTVYGQDNAMAARGGGGTDHLRLAVNGYELKLTATTTDAPLQYYGGFAHPYADGGYTYYYSRPRMQAVGSVLTPQGETLPVTGRVWFDRQAGDLNPVIDNGYQWFALGFDNGIDAMVAKLSHSGGTPHPDNYAAVHDAGQLYTLGPNDFSVTPQGKWTSPNSGSSYPSAWQVRIPSQNIDVLVRPCLPDQELVPPTWWFAAIERPYWEGACDILDASGQQRLGQAYAEVANPKK